MTTVREGLQKLWDSRRERSLHMLNHLPPFPAECSFRLCDLPGQCRGEGKCHHPKGQATLEELATHVEEARKLRQELNLAADAHHAWQWQGDGHDNLETMGANMAVLIRAADLRALIAVPATLLTELLDILDRPIRMPSTMEDPRTGWSQTRRQQCTFCWRTGDEDDHIEHKEECVFHKHLAQEARKKELVEQLRGLAIQKL